MEKEETTQTKMATPQGEQKGPDLMLTRITEIQDHINQNRPADALEMAINLRRDWPDAPMVSIKLFQAYLANGIIPSAAAELVRFETLENKTLPDHILPKARFDLRRAQADDRGLLDAALQLAGIPGALPPPDALAAAEASVRLGHLAAYDRLFPHFKSKRNSLRGVRLAYERFRATSPGSSPTRLIEAFVVGPDAIPENVHAIQYHLTIFGHDQNLAEELINLALARWPDDPTVAEVAGRYKTTDANRATSAQSETPDSLRSWIASQNWRGHKGNALLEAFDRDVGKHPPLRALAVAAPDQDVIESPVLDGAPTAIVFTGLGDMLGGTLTLLDAYLAMAGYNAIYLRDLSSLMGGNGIASLGADVESTAEALVEMLKRRDTTASIVVGNSAGGLSALNYAPLLGAPRIVAFSTPTIVTQEFLARIEDNRINLLNPRFLSDVSEAYGCARPFIDAAAPRPMADLYFDPLSHPDAAHANALSDDPCVRLHHVAAGGKHGIWKHMIIEGTFVEALKGW